MSMAIWGRPWNEGAYKIKIAVPSVFGYANAHSKVGGKHTATCSLLLSLLLSSYFICPLSTNCFPFQSFITITMAPFSILLFLLSFLILCCPRLLLALSFWHSIFQVHSFPFLQRLILPRNIWLSQPSMSNDPPTSQNTKMQKLAPSCLFYTQKAEEKPVPLEKYQKKKEFRTSTCSDFSPSGKHTFIGKNSQQQCWKSNIFRFNYNNVS